ncbi:hypothetical protein EVAR_26421_1 [Eumeta japonica]|uniref:Uncharacterized protein n=1 Tax=Eumeta variegata TaxID=151549 RepID=A0A4C1VQX3_EUMVA|nr:hypothetical protein EVAR_26421_1 [Eumeta japonica]
MRQRGFRIGFEGPFTHYPDDTEARSSVKNTSAHRNGYQVTYGCNHCDAPPTPTSTPPTNYPTVVSDPIPSRYVLNHNEL